MMEDAFVSRSNRSQEEVAAMKGQFTMIIARDPESGWLVGDIVELPGCHTEAPDLASLDAAMREAIELYLETTELDEPLPDFVGTWRIDIPA